MHDFTGEWFDNRMTSWICGKDIAYVFCDGDANSDCWNHHGISGAGSAYNTNIRDNDSLTTVKMIDYDPINDKGAVTVFQNGNCSGI